MGGRRRYDEEHSRRWSSGTDWYIHLDACGMHGLCSEPRRRASSFTDNANLRFSGFGCNPG